MANIVYSSESKQDLEEIGDYIAINLKNPIAALNTVDKIQNRIARLAELPTIGIQLSAIAGIDSDYRLLVCGNHIAFFHTNGCTIYIDRILYGKRDYLSILYPDLPKDDSR